MDQRVRLSPLITSVKNNFHMSEFWRDNISLEDEPYKVMILRDQLIDEARNDRVVKIKTYYPVEKKYEEPNHSAPARLRHKTGLPVIIWSHGLGGSVDGAAFLARFLCAYGYIIVNVQHHGTDSSLWEGKEGHPWDIIRSQVIERSATLNRFKDIPFLLDQLPEYFKQHDNINADLSTIGMSGHSFGALTTQVAGGMLFPDETGKLQKYADDRFKAGILYSPGPIAHLGVDAPEDIYGSIDIPLLHITGTDDDSPVENWDYKKRLVVYENSTRAAKHLLIIKDGDHMVFNGSRGKLGVNPNKDKHEGIIKIAALAYWDMMLKNDGAAKEWLTVNGFTGWLGEEGTFQ